MTRQFWAGYVIAAVLSAIAGWQACEAIGTDHNRPDAARVKAAHADGGAPLERPTQTPRPVATRFVTRTPPATVWAEGAGEGQPTPDSCDCARREMLGAWYVAEADSPEVRAAATAIMASCAGAVNTPYGSLNTP